MGRKREVPRVPVAVYRLKPSSMRDSFAGVLAEEKKRDTRTFDVDLGASVEARIFVRSTDPRLPRWAGFLLQLDPRLRNAFEEYASNAAVLVVVNKGTRYALAFGQGRVLLDSKVVERGFGLRCALDMVSGESLVGVDLRDVGPTTLYSQIQANKNVTFSEFRVDTEASLLNGVRGHADPIHEFYSQAEGLDALYVNPRLTPTKIVPFIEFVDRIYLRNGYLSKGYDWVDNVSIVRDTLLETELEKLMDIDLASRSTTVRFGSPEFIDQKEIDAFRVVGMGRGSTNDIAVATIKRARHVKILTAALLREIKIQALDPDGNAMRAWRAWNWACWVTKYNGKHYVLHDGSFYAVEPSYEKRIDQFIMGIRKLAKSWPDWNVTSPGNESEYNTFMSAKLGASAVLLDRKPYAKAFRGKGALELCDVFVKGSPVWLVCVKTYTKSSSPISHLIMQGANAAETLLEDPAFRRDVRKTPGLKRFIPKDAPEPSSIGVAFLILTNKRRRRLTSLPFFSKLALYRFARAAKARGIQVRAGTRARGL